MSKKEVWYAVIGGYVGAVLTLAVPLNGNFGKIICKELKVVGSDGKPRVTLSIGGYGGRVDVFGGGDHYYGGKEPVAKSMFPRLGFGYRLLRYTSGYGCRSVWQWRRVHLG